MKSSANPDDPLLCVRELTDEPLERLEERARDDIDFGIAALRRLKRRLPKWLRPGDQPDLARCVAAVAAINTALALLSPVHLRQLAKRIQRGELPRRKGA